MYVRMHRKRGGGHATLENFSNFNRGSEMPFTAFSAGHFQ